MVGGEMEVRVRNFDDSGREIVRKLEWHRVCNNTYWSHARAKTGKINEQPDEKSFWLGSNRRFPRLVAFVVASKHSPRIHGRVETAIVWFDIRGEDLRTIGEKRARKRERERDISTKAYK